MHHLIFLIPAYKAATTSLVQTSCVFAKSTTPRGQVHQMRYKPHVPSQLAKYSRNDFPSIKFCFALKQAAASNQVAQFSPLLQAFCLQLSVLFSSSCKLQHSLNLAKFLKSTSLIAGDDHESTRCVAGVVAGRTSKLWRTFSAWSGAFWRTQFPPFSRCL